MIAATQCTPMGSPVAEAPAEEQQAQLDPSVVRYVHGDCAEEHSPRISPLEEPRFSEKPNYVLNRLQYDKLCGQIRTYMEEAREQVISAAGVNAGAKFGFKLSGFRANDIKDLVGTALARYAYGKENSFADFNTNFRFTFVPGTEETKDNYAIEDLQEHEYTQRALQLDFFNQGTLR